MYVHMYKCMDEMPMHVYTMGNCTGGVPVHMCTHVQVYRWGYLCICVHMCRCIDGGVCACVYTCASAQVECLCMYVYMIMCTGAVPGED